MRISEPLRQILEKRGNHGSDSGRTISRFHARHVFLAGLLDDSYLVIRILQNLDRGEAAFLDWDLEAPMRFLRRLMGAQVSERLDGIAAEAMLDVSDNLAEVWDRLSHEA